MLRCNAFRPWLIAQSYCVATEFTCMPVWRAVGVGLLQATAQAE
jgi:hypothetical protein